MLGDGHPGVAMLAASRTVPIYPVAHTGFNKIVRSILHLRRTRVTLRVGRPFRIVLPGGRATPSQLRSVTREIMYQLAALLPAELRGRYRDLSAATTEYLAFTET